MIARIGYILRNNSFCLPVFFSSFKEYFFATEIRTVNYLWASTASSGLASGIIMGAIPILLVNIGASPMDVSVASAAATLPWFIFSPFAGVLIDRCNRSHLSKIIEYVRTMIWIVIAILFMLNMQMVWLLSIGIFLSTCGEVFVDGSIACITQQIAPPDKLSQANSKIISTERVTNGFLGVPIGSFLAGIFPLVSVSVTAFGYFISSLFLAPLKRSTPPPQRSNDSSTFFQNAIEGFSHIFKTKMMSRIILCKIFMNLAISCFVSIGVFYVQDFLLVSKNWLGIVLSSEAVGCFVSGVVFTKYKPKDNLRALQLIMLMIFMLAYIGLCLIPYLPIALILFFFIGFSAVAASSVNRTLFQKLTPPSLLGRVQTAMQLFSSGVFPIGAILGGIGITYLGIQNTMFGASLCTIIGFLLMVVMTRRKDYEI